MNAPHRPFQPRSAKPFVTAFLSALLAIGLVGGVTTLFQSRGQPWGELVAATAACQRSTVAAERKACHERLATVPRAAQVATQ